MDCPESIVGSVGVGAVGVVSAGPIVNVDEYTEFTVSDTASVTITLNFSGLFDVSALTVVYVKVFVVDATPVKSMFAVIASVALFDISQLYVYGLVPPDTVAVQLTVCPTSSADEDGQEDKVGVDRTGATTVRVPVFTELVVSGVEAESVMNTFADIVLPASAVGTSHRKVLLVPAIPTYRAFATRASVTVLKTR